MKEMVSVYYYYFFVSTWVIEYLGHSVFVLLSRWSYHGAETCTRNDRCGTSFCLLRCAIFFGRLCCNMLFGILLFLNSEVTDARTCGTIFRNNRIERNGLQMKWYAYKNMCETGQELRSIRACWNNDIAKKKFSTQRTWCVFSLFF